MAITVSTATRLAGASILALSLAACMDVSMTIDVLSESEAEATMVTSMGADMYEMMSAQTMDGDDDFCADGEIVETAETVDCVVVQRGPFDELDLDADDGGPVIAALGNGQVRVSFPTGELAETMAEDTGAGDDPQMMAMITSMFEGHFITMTVSGGPITDTNMTVAADGLSAHYEIPFVDLFGTEINLPDEIYAVVQK